MIQQINAKLEKMRERRIAKMSPKVREAWEAYEKVVEEERDAKN